MRYPASYSLAIAILSCSVLWGCASPTADTSTGDDLINDGSFDLTVSGAVTDHVDTHYAIWDSAGGNGLSGPGIDLGNVAGGSPAQPSNPKAVFFFPTLTGASDSVINLAFHVGVTTVLQQLPSGNINFRIEYEDGPANATWIATDGQFSISQVSGAHLIGAFTFHATSATHTGVITVTGTFDAVDDPNLSDGANASRFAARRQRGAPSASKR